MGTGKTEYNSANYDDILNSLKESENYVNKAYGHMSSFYNNTPSDSKLLEAIRKEATKYDSSTNELLEIMSEENEAALKRQYYYPYTNAHDRLNGLKGNTNQINDNLGIIVSSVTAINEAAKAFEDTKGFETNGEPNAAPSNSDGTGGFGNGNGTSDFGNGTGVGNAFDLDGDGKADQNTDNNGTKKPDLNIDTDGDGKADQNIDTDDDGKADLNIDTDGDGKADLNIDTDGDGKADLNIDTDGDGKADLNIDTDGDGKADLNIDTDGDGYADTNIDINGDGIPDVNVDTDGDGKPDKNVIPGYEHGAGNSDDDNFLSDLLKHMKLMVDDDGNIMYYDQSGNIVYPFLGEGMFANPSNAQKYKVAENAFLEMLDGPERGEAVEALDLDLEKSVPSASFAIGGMAAVGAAAANAAATMKRTKDEIDDGVRTYDYEYDDDSNLTPEQYKKRKTGTIISTILLTLLVVANAIALVINGTSDVTIVLLGLAIAITGIITSMGIKQGKFYTIGAVLVNLLIVYVLTCLEFTTSLGYGIAFAVLVVVLLYYYFTKLFERILPMFNYVPAVVGIVGIGFVGLLSVFDITHWIINIILVILIICGYFAYNYFGIAKLEEQIEQEKQKGLSVYDYFNLKTNKKQWKYNDSVGKTLQNDVNLSNYKNTMGNNQDNYNSNKNNNSKFFN